MTPTSSTTGEASSPYPPASDHRRTVLEQQNVALALSMFSAGWGANTGWEDTWRKVLAPDFTSYFHAFPPVNGVEAAIAFNRDLFLGFPSLHVSVGHVTVEGDSVVVQNRLTGNHDGPFLGIPASGVRIDVPDVTLFRLRDGKIAEMRYFTDLLTTLTKMGAIPPLH